MLGVQQSMKTVVSLKEFNILSWRMSRKQKITIRFDREPFSCGDARPPNPTWKVRD